MRKEVDLFRYIRTIAFLCKEYKRIHPKASAIKFWVKTWCVPNEELYRIADAVSRFGAENFYR